MTNKKAPIQPPLYKPTRLELIVEGINHVFSRVTLCGNWSYVFFHSYDTTTLFELLEEADEEGMAFYAGEIRRELKRRHGDYGYGLPTPGWSRHRYAVTFTVEVTINEVKKEPIDFDYGEQNERLQHRLQRMPNAYQNFLLHKIANEISSCGVDGIATWIAGSPDDEQHGLAPVIATMSEEDQLVFALEEITGTFNESTRLLSESTTATIHGCSVREV